MRDHIRTKHLERIGQDHPEVVITLKLWLLRHEMGQITLEEHAWLRPCYVE